MMSIRIPHSLFELAAGRNLSLSWYHAVGVLVTQITPTKRGQAGSSMKQIADEVFGDRRMLPTLYACRRFARIIRDCELPTLEGLSWKHVHYLISVRNKRLRDQLVVLAKARRLTARQLELAIQERLGKRTNGGRKPRAEYLAPKAACRESMRLCNDLARRLPIWLRNARSKPAPQPEADAETELLLASTRASIRAAQRVLRDELRRL